VLFLAAYSRSWRNPAPLEDLVQAQTSFSCPPTLKNLARVLIVNALIKMVLFIFYLKKMF
jgi:hypothetical protein